MKSKVSKRSAVEFLLDPPNVKRCKEHLNVFLDRKKHILVVRSWQMLYFRKNGKNKRVKLLHEECFNYENLTLK